MANLSVAQKKALARGRAKLKAMRRRGETPKRKRNVAPKKKAVPKRRVVRRRNPNTGLWSKVDNLQRHIMAPPYLTKRQFEAETQTEQKRYYNWLRKQGGYSADILEVSRPKAKRRRNPDPALMRTGVLRSPTKAGKKRLTNPPHYVVTDGKRFFDGAGWTVRKQFAAQYTTQKVAKFIGQKVADATGKSVYVVPV